MRPARRSPFSLASGIIESISITKSAPAAKPLAGERTELAWWRTGLAALAVAVGIGRLAPELQKSGATWPYVLVGVGFALYGIALFTQGTIRGRQEAGALGEEKHAMDWRAAALAAAGPLLGLAVVALIALA